MTGMKGPFDDPQAARTPSLAEFEALAARCYARLPAHFRNLCEDLVIRVEDFPTPEVVAHMAVDSR